MLLYFEAVSFVSLQEHLRRELRRRIDAGEVTGTELARRTGFTQAHISNFMNRKRGLKLPALDRVLKAIGLSLYDLLNPHDLTRYAAAPSGKDVEYAEVPLVDPVAASSEVIVNDQVRELVKVPRAILHRFRPQLATPARKSWTRFLFLRLNEKEGINLSPRLSPGAMLLLDRHYNSLRSYRKGSRNLYGVRKPVGCAVGHVEPGGNVLILRPANPDSPVEILAIPQGQNIHDLLLGRVAYVMAEI